MPQNPFLTWGSRKKRKSPTRSLKNLIWEKQHGKCWRCHKLLSPSYAEYHHKNGRRSDTRKSNLALVCSNCHKILSNEQRVRGKGKRGVRRGSLLSLPKIKPTKLKYPKIRF